MNKEPGDEDTYSKDYDAVELYIDSVEKIEKP